MSNANFNLKNSSASLPAHQVKRFSRDGYPLMFASNQWQVSKDKLVLLEWINCLDENIRLSARKALAHVAEEYSGAHAANVASRMSHFIKTTQIHFITSETLINYRASLDKTAVWYLGVVRVFLKKWFELGYPGISKETIDLLSSWRLSGNEKGQAVLSVDPENGPFSDFELSAIHDKLVEAYAAGQINAEDFAMTLTIANTGRRPRQIGDLKVGDIYQAKNKDGISTYFINFPRRKLRGVLWRSQFRAYAISEDLWQALNKHIESVTHKLSRMLGREL